MPGEHKAVHVHVTGRVQGVGFRDWTRREAVRLGLAGWVRNEDDGSVVALIVGAENTVAEMIVRLWMGPRMASVSDVKTQSATLSETPNNFRIV